MFLKFPHLPVIFSIHISWVGLVQLHLRLWKRDHILWAFGSIHGFSSFNFETHLWRLFFIIDAIITFFIFFF